MSLRRTYIAWPRWRSAGHAVLIACLLCLPLLTQAGGVKPGQAAPEVSLPLLPGGETLTLSSLSGTVVYLDFWASWCGPCRISFPQLEALRQELGGRGFEVYAISVDEVRESALGFLEEFSVSYPVLIDSSGATPQTYGVLGMPTGYLIDRQGIVREVHQGYQQGDGVNLRSAILELLAED